MKIFEEGFEVKEKEGLKKETFFFLGKRWFVLGITDDAITTRPDLQHLGWALSAHLHHHPAYLMSKESSCL